jgi:hypothetical protein
MVAAMDKVGVDGAIFISAFSMYRYDASYAVEVNGPIPNGSSSSRCLGQRIQPLDDQVSFAQQSTIFATHHQKYAGNCHVRGHQCFNLAQGAVEKGGHFVFGRAARVSD